MPLGLLVSAEISDGSYPRLLIRAPKTAFCVENRSTSTRYAAKLVAFSLFAAVRSTSGRRKLLPSRVPFATGSYAAQASNIAVWVMANARAAIGGALFVLRIASSVASFH